MPKLIYNNYTEDIQDLYSKGLECKEIATKLNLHSTTVSRIAKTININFHKGNKNRRLHSINEDFFSVINNEEKAYFLGLLYADGCIVLLNKRSWQMKLGLWEKDKYILEYLNKLLFKNPDLHNISTRISNKPSVQNFCTFNIYSKKICDDLQRLGCVQRKSLILEFPQNIPKNLVHHFIRGYFDGDGCFIGRKTGFCISFNFVSSNNFISGLQKQLLEFGIKSQTYIHSKNSSRNSILRNSSLENVMKFYNLIYKDANIFMKRKRQFADNYLAQLNEKLNISLMD